MNSPPVDHEKRVELCLQLPDKVIRRLSQVADVKGVTLTSFVEQIVESALGKHDLENPSLKTRQEGYWWKEVFLPHGTQLSFVHKGQMYVAFAVGKKLLFEGKAVSPSEFINSVSDTVRNAWRDLRVQRPADESPIPAYQVRKQATDERLAKLRVSYSASSKRPPPLRPLPITKKTGPRYLRACVSVIRVINEGAASHEMLNEISEAKGMFNRVALHDQRDWPVVQELLGHPDEKTCAVAAEWLYQLRQLAESDDRALLEHCGSDEAQAVKLTLTKAEAALRERGVEI